MTRYKQIQNQSYCTSNELVVIALTFTPTVALAVGDIIDFGELPANHAIVDASCFLGNVDANGNAAELSGVNFDLGIDDTGKTDFIFAGAQPASGVLTRLTSTKAFRNGALDVDAKRGLIMTLKSAVTPNGGTLNINITIRARQLGH